MKTRNIFNIRNILVFLVIAILIVAIVFMLLVILAPGSKLSNLTAKFSELVGTVQVRNGAQGTFNQIYDGFVLSSSMQAQTLENSRARLDLSSGTILRLGQNTLFSLSSNQSSSSGLLTKFELQAGRIWIVLNGGSVDVTTPSGVASVRGSYMFVWVVPNSNETTVCCLEGVCQYSNKAGEVNLGAGQKIITTDPNTLPSIQPMDQSDFQLWLDNVPEAVSIVTQEATILASPTPTETVALPTDTSTSTPSLTPTVTDTPTPAIPMVSVSADTNCRVGPGTVYDGLGVLHIGETAQVIGRIATNDYWVIILPSNTAIKCWVWGNYATVTGDTSSLPIFTPPPTPTPTITPTPTATPKPTITPTYILRYSP